MDNKERTEDKTVKSVREMAVEEFNKNKDALMGSEVMNWHIWKRAFDCAFRRFEEQQKQELKSGEKEEYDVEEGECSHCHKRELCDGFNCNLGTNKIYIRK